jgi:transposase
MILDKAKVEKGVQYSETWVLARLRNFTFFSLQQLNETIQELLVELNNQPFQKVSGTRYSQYQALDLPALGPLPEQPFELEHWLINVLIEKDYHVTVEGHHYSVPHHLRCERVDVRYTDAIVEVFHNNLRVASHIRNKLAGGMSTLDEHRPAKHALYAGMSAELFLQKAAEVGVFTRQVILEAHPYPQLAFDKCFGLLFSLRRKYGDDRLESVAEYALRIGSPTYRVMKVAIENGCALPRQLTISTFDGHDNIRGPMEFA